MLGCVPYVPSSSTNSTLLFENENYVGYIGDVQLGTPSRTKLSPNPVIPLGQAIPLKFDLLQEDFQYLNVKIYHCNVEWGQSQLNDLEFLNEFNEFPVNNYQFSQNTLESYVSYNVTLPSVTKSGNYVIAVYEENKLLFSRKLVVYERLFDVFVELKRSSVSANRNTHHQFDVEFNYGNLEVVAPDRDLKVVIIQNRNWESVLTLPSPTTVDVSSSDIKYEHFNGDNNLPAGNEFRFFDTRSLSFRGLSVNYITTSSRGIETILEVDKSRKGLAYSQPFQDDWNGNYQLGNRDPNEDLLQSEYTWVNFTLESENLNSEIYVTGQWNNWSKKPENQLRYDFEKRVYFGSLLLKQGFYNYQYQVVGNPETNYFEGNHFDTINSYEVLVYYREPGMVYDRVVSYREL
jgi:hypothetical protein